MKRLFIPLQTRWHTLFQEGKKTWELRGINSQFNKRTVYPGRPVELRRGYQYDPLFGTITNVLCVQTLEEIPQDVMDLTVPIEIQGDLDIISFIEGYRKNYDAAGYILFEVQLK